MTEILLHAGSKAGQCSVSAPQGDVGIRVILLHEAKDNLPLGRPVERIKVDHGSSPLCNMRWWREYTARHRKCGGDWLTPRSLTAADDYDTGRTIHTGHDQ